MTSKIEKTKEKATPRNEISTRAEQRKVMPISRETKEIPRESEKPVTRVEFRGEKFRSDPQSTTTNSTARVNPTRTTSSTNDDFFSKPLNTPKEDFFSKELKNNKIVDQGIPVIKNNKLESEVVTA